MKKMHLEFARYFERVFVYLKAGRAQPDAEAAMTVADDLESNLNSGKYNHAPQVTVETIC